jgi:hypothetical protein
LGFTLLNASAKGQGKENFARQEINKLEAIDCEFPCHAKQKKNTIQQRATTRNNHARHTSSLYSYRLLCARIAGETVVPRQESVCMGEDGRVGSGAFRCWRWRCSHRPAAAAAATEKVSLGNIQICITGSCVYPWNPWHAMEYCTVSRGVTEPQVTWATVKKESVSTV